MMGYPVEITARSIVFGSMRMLEYDYSLDYWVQLFSDLHDFGVTTFHSSNEYESFPFFCEVLSVFRVKYPLKKIKHIVKIAEPHFHINEFDGFRLEKKIDEYCTQLNVDKIDVVQWMWRGNLEDHLLRESFFEKYDSEIKESVFQIKSSGKIDRFCCFPYSENFALAAIKKEYVDGLIVYRNLVEQEYDDALLSSESLGKESYVLRPLNAGKALLEEDQTPKKLIHFALDFPNLIGAIVSISSMTKIKQLI